MKPRTLAPPFYYPLPCPNRSHGFDLGRLIAKNVQKIIAAGKNVFLYHIFKLLWKDAGEQKKLLEGIN
jgi:hypothetical protein